MKRGPENTNSAADKKIHWRRIAKKTGKCDRCPPHDKENRGRRPRSDKHKNHRTK